MSASQYYKVTARVGVPHRNSVEVTIPLVGPQGPVGATGATGAVGPQGPQGIAGTGIETLTTKGDLLSRNDSAAIRVGIGTTGQILKVSAQGLPHWANESGAVSSVAGRTGTVTLASVDISSEQVLEISEAGDANCNGVFVYGGIFNGRPTYYKDKDTFVYWDNVWNISRGSDDQYFGTDTSRPWQAVWSLGSATGNLPVVEQLNGQEYEKAVGQRTNPTLFGSASGKNVGTGANDVAAGNDARFSDARQPLSHSSTHASSGSDPVFDQNLNTADSPTFATVDASQVTFGSNTYIDVAQGEWMLNNQLIFSAVDPSSAQAALGLVIGTDVAAASHNHAASAITSGTLTHERGGLEADVSAYNGLVKISGGATSAVTVTTAGEALLDDADAATQRTTLGLGGAATLSVGTTTGTVAAGDDSRFHTRSHAMTGTSDHTASNWSVFYSNGSGQVTELALGAANTVLTSNGASSAPSFAAASGSGSTSIWLPASFWIPRTTNGCGVDSRELSTNRTNWDELLFDAASDEFAQALVVMPSNYNNGTITARFYWTASGATDGSDNVVWGIQGRAFANDDALDQAMGTAQTVQDTVIATNDMHVSAATSAVTIAGTPAAQKPILFQIYRDADATGAGGDDYNHDARLLGVEIIFN